VGGSEKNLESIRVLEDQIREHERVLARLKRTRNSLLNVSRLPPEVLGDIFRRNVTLKGDFDCQADLTAHPEPLLANAEGIR